VGDAQLAAGAEQVQIVHALDFGVVGVDDLPVENVLGERHLLGRQVQFAQRLFAPLEHHPARVALRDVLPLDALDRSA
jgi:hypothetical protein